MSTELNWSVYRQQYSAFGSWQYCNNKLLLYVISTGDLGLTDSVVEETSRLASGVFMVRYINEDTQFKTSDGKDHLMRKGDRVAIYPPAIHKHPEIFAEPLVSIYKIFFYFNCWTNSEYNNLQMLYTI